MSDRTEYDRDPKTGARTYYNPPSTFHFGRFVREHREQILIGAVIYLTLKNRGLQSDIRKLSKASMEIIDGLENVIIAGEVLDAEVVNIYATLRTTTNAVRRHENTLSDHTAILTEITKDRILDSKSEVPVPLMDQFFGPRSKN